MMNILKTLGGAQTANADTVRVLDIEDMDFVSGGRTVDLTAPDPTNPQCPGLRWHPDFSNHGK
jgi:hypothetical protein